ncbi:TetR/AcrR family transcriptional regulator [Streptomyces beijiangensis]|uniref:TetR/AcrR family transcriptional regulator n=1 Tax=Streptomyces beijiangensis TaxID=163361 RepID=A0A939FEY4_9ACTN|nr:TetR/AcrR family transcriptional regulator [Streptomyces beijiangensis]MBO0516162.1 TetR/AcrR family transcriptional regulator [Streptomyces beijiangensis]
MNPPAAPQSRRERLRAETSAEIKDIALKLLGEGGPDAISLRAIAREMGMTAGAIYGYYENRDTLVTALITDVYGTLLDTAEAARDKVPATDPAGRIVAWGMAVRAWALANPEGFRLIYGDPVPGYRPPAEGPVAEAGHRACAALTGLVAAAWPKARKLQSATSAWSDFDPALVAQVREEFPGLPPEALALSLRVWARMHGPVSLEVYGHLGRQSRDLTALYRAELADLVRSLGL